MEVVNNPKTNGAIRHAIIALVHAMVCTIRVKMNPHLPAAETVEIAVAMEIVEEMDAALGEDGVNVLHGHKVPTIR